MQGLPSSLIRTESGGNFRARNDVAGSGGSGHFGRGQFSRGRLQDAMRAGVIPQGTTPEQFLASEAMQKRVEEWHVRDIMTRIEKTGINRSIGQKINGVEVTPEGLLAVAHLGGFGGMKRFVESGGQYNPSDAFGTSLADYLRTHGQSGGVPEPGNALAMGSPPARPNNALALAAPQMQPLEAARFEAPVLRAPTRRL